MIIKEISTQSIYPDGTRPELFRDSNNYTPEQWRTILKYLKENAAISLLKYEVIEL